MYNLGISRWYRFRGVGGVLFVLAVLICSLSHFSFVYAETSGADPAQTLPSPIDGQPHEITKTTQDFNFTWHMPDEAPSGVKYQVRASMAKNQLETASDATSTAWFSDIIEINSLPFRSIEDATDGTWYWQVRAVQGNSKSEWSDIWQVKVDTHIPTITLQNPADQQLFGGISPTVDFTAVFDDPSGMKSYAVQLDGVDKTKVILQGAVMNRVSTNGSFVGEELTEGSHTMTLIGTNQLGNRAELSRTFAIDKTAPILSANVSDGQKLKGQIQVGLSGVDDHPNIYRIQIVKENQIITQVEGDSSGNITYNWDTTAAANGEYKIIFYGKDKVGNEAQLERAVVVDNTTASEVINTTTGTDPLLDELSKQLTQPFPPASSATASPVEEPPVQPKKANNGTVAKAILPQAEQVSRPVVVPSDQGWRILGVPWHWWLSAIVLVMLIFYRWLQMTRSYRLRSD